MKAQDLQILKNSLQLIQQLEDSHGSQGFPEPLLFKLSGLLKSFATSPQLELQKLAQIPEHLHPEMELRHLLNFSIPIERALGRSLRDDQFLVSSQDRSQTETPRAPLVFVLENLRSAFNVGSIFRLADCLSVCEVWLVGYTLDPSNEQLQKTSLGSTASVPWKSSPTLESALTSLRQRGYHIVALETAEKAKSLYDFPIQKTTALVVGNERFGLEASALRLCDEVLCIPTFGTKNSLNVSQALAIGGYEWMRQCK